MPAHRARPNQAAEKSAPAAAAPAHARAPSQPHSGGPGGGALGLGGIRGSGQGRRAAGLPGAEAPKGRQSRAAPAE